MKKFLFILLGIIAVALLAFAFTCGKFVETGSEYGRWFVIKKVDGKKQWGVDLKRDAVAVLSFGNRGYGYITIDEDEIGYPFAQTGIKCKYDQIEFKKVAESMMFIGHKGSELYYYDENADWFADEKPVYKMENLGKSSSRSLGYTWEYKFYTPEGVYIHNTGPYEDIFVGLWGYAIKQNGGWGYVYGRHDIKTEGQDRFKQTVPCLYDEIIEAIDTKQLHNKVFARKGNTWVVYDNEGNKTSAPASTIQAAKRTKDKKTDRPFFTHYYR